MKPAPNDDALLSREELDALLEEMPKEWSDRGSESGPAGQRVADVELQRANEEFAFEQGLLLSNRHQRVISFSLIGQREIEIAELSELMLPTDLAAMYRIMPKALDGFLLLSRPLFFQLLSMSFGSGPTIKPTRPPTREYSRIERRFYRRAASQMLEQLESAWQEVAPANLAFGGLVSRAAVAEVESERAILATFDVKGFGEACRVRVAIPAEAFTMRDGAPTKSVPSVGAGTGVSLLDVPIALRARVGTTEMSLSDVAKLEVGQLLLLDTPSDGSLIVRIGEQDKFKGVAGARGPKRAVQLGDRLDGAEHAR